MAHAALTWFSYLQYALVQSKSPHDFQKDPEDFSWIKNYAAIGDSFAAGIGAGNVLNGPEDSACSRYDGAAPELINRSLGPSQRKYQFLACSGDTTSQVRNQVKNLGSEDLVTLSAGGNDVGFETVLKNCIYLPHSESDCDNALGAAQKLINDNLEKNIDGLLDDLNKKMAVNGIVVFTMYAKFFNADTNACNDKTWTYLDPTGSSGLKLTKERRKRLNDMVDSANQKIQNAINSFCNRYEIAKIELVTASWDNFVGATKGRFCEDGASDNPDDNVGLVFQRLDNTPRFIPPEKVELVKAAKREAAELHGTSEVRLPHLKPRAPDTIARVFHPTEFGQTIISAFALMALTNARDKQLIGGPDASTCPHDAKKPELPGADAKDPSGKNIGVSCGRCSDFYSAPSDVESAISNFCSQAGKNFFMGDNPVSHTVGEPSHIFTNGVSLKNQTEAFYQDKNSCSIFDEKINSDDCNFAFKAINDKCNPTGGPLKPYC